MNLGLIVGIELILMVIAIVIRIRVSRALRDIDGFVGTVKKKQLPGVRRPRDSGQAS